MTEPVIGIDYDLFRRKIMGDCADRGGLSPEFKGVDELQNENIRDALTGVYNRRYFNEIMSSKGDSGMGLAFLDLDNFKGINDTHGHLVGDAYLKAFARKLNDSVRETRVGTNTNDMIFRYGGDEFVIIFNGKLNKSTLFIKCEKLRNDIEKLVIDNNGEKIGVTVSIGFGIRKPGEVVDDFVRKADMAVYGAKLSGGNQVFSLEK